MSKGDAGSTLPEQIRQVIREEFERIVPELRHGQAYLTLRETAQRYRLGYSTVKDKVENGELLIVRRALGRNGRCQILVVAMDAEQKLGPGRIS